MTPAERKLERIKKSNPNLLVLARFPDGSIRFSIPARVSKHVYSVRGPSGGIVLPSGEIKWRG